MSELQQAINEMRNMRESYDQLGAAAEAYNTGKAELVANINSKGVEASASETLPELAEKVAAISQETYEINGGEMYAKQLFGSLETPNYWNLYEVLANLLSDGRLVQYGGILLAEYYRGYDSLALAGAGAGGAYVVSDKDENGQFKMYTQDTTHTWATEFDGKGNRWVAYCFADEGHDFQITDTNTSPRSIFIGRHVGVIESLVNGRVSEIVVTDGNKLDEFNTGVCTQNWGKNVVLKNIQNDVAHPLLIASAAMENVYLELKDITTLSHVFSNSISNKNFNFIIKFADMHDTTYNTCMLKCNNASVGIIYIEAEDMVMAGAKLVSGCSAGTIIVKANKISHTLVNNDIGCIFNYVSCNKLFMEVEEISTGLFYSGNGINYIYIGYINNDKTKSIHIYAPNSSFKIPSIVELKNGICKNINIADLITNMTEENIRTYILQRLKQDEPDCGVGVTITLGSTNLAKLTSEESQALLAELRGTYGYTFA